MQVGGLDVLPVLDGTVRFNPSEAYRTMGGPDQAAGKGLAEEDWAPHRGLLDARRHARARPRRIPDPDVRPHRPGRHRCRRPSRRIPSRAASCSTTWPASDVAPADVTDVVFTHLHFDHVGWATTHGEVVFPNATYRCDQRDWDHFVTGDPEGGGARKLRPITERLQTWDRDGSILPGLDAMAAPGHTPGSTIVVVSDRTQRALLLGDVVHCPVELLDDEWDGMGDVDPKLAKRTRAALTKEIEGKDLPVAAAHFPGMRFGRLLAGEGRRQWVV